MRIWNLRQDNKAAQVGCPGQVVGVELLLVCQVDEGRLGVKLCHRLVWNAKHFCHSDVIFGSLNWFLPHMHTTDNQYMTKLTQRYCKKKILFWNWVSNLLTCVSWPGLPYIHELGLLWSITLPQLETSTLGDLAEVPSTAYVVTNNITNGLCIQ